MNNTTARALARQVEAFTQQMPTVETESEASRRRARDVARDQTHERWG